VLAKEIKLTATTGAGHLEPINRFLAVAADEARSQGILVCRTESKRALPGGRIAIPWHSFSNWLSGRLSEIR
jgi:hypothetical protein